MSNSNVINEKKKALLAYKEKILDDIKYSEKRIDDFRANLKNNRFYDNHADSSDSEDDFPSAIDLGPSITQLKLQQAMKKTCLHATQELTGLMVLQSEVDVLVEEPKFEGEPPVTESGTWREVTAECRVDLVPFTMTFFMHTPNRKFGPPSYRALRVVPVKNSHELELSKSVLHSLKVPSDAVEVIRSYAAGYRSRRTTLARLANKYTNALFMEPHVEGGFVLKCADLLEVSWKLENKWSPVAPFHHRMKFDLEFMEESYIKIITQAHKELLDPALQTDERTLLLAKIIATCLEARGPIDPESDLESKTTERDNDIDRRDIDNEKRDSEVMAPPKSLPKKSKQKKTSSLPNTAEKRKNDDDNDDTGAKKMKNDVSEAKKSITDDNNPRKSKINEVVSEGGKKRKISEPTKVVSNKIVKETGINEDGNTKSKEIHKEDKLSNTKAKNVKETDKNAKNLKENEVNNADKPKNIKESSSKDKNANIKTKNKVSKEAGDTVAKEANPKAKSSKEPAKIDNNSKHETKTIKNSVKNQENGDNAKLKEKNTTDTVQNKESETNKAVKEPANTDKVKNQVNKAKNTKTKEKENTEENTQNQNNNKIIKKVKNVANVKSKENIDNIDAVRPKSKITEKITNNEKKITSNINKIDNKTKNTDATKKNVADTKNDEQATKKAPEKNSNVASAKNDGQSKKVLQKNDKNKEKLPEVANKISQKNINEKPVQNNAQTVKKVTEKNATNAKIKDKISQIITKVPEKIVNKKAVPLQDKPEKIISSNLNTKNKNIIKKPIITKLASHRNSLKPLNPPKGFKAGNTKTQTGNIEKENGGKGSKIPQKTLSIVSEGSSKKNLLRMSPRIISSKLKTQPHMTLKEKMLKYTNIPRLLKKPAPKMT